MFNPKQADDWLTLATHWPDLLSCVAGSVAAFTVASAIDLYFLPVPANDAQRRRQQGGLFLFCWIAGTAGSVGMWSFLDVADPWAMRIIISLIVCGPAYTLYPLFARVAAGLLKKFFNIDLSSAWSK